VEFLAKARVMSSTVFVSEASNFSGLASVKNHITKNITPDPPIANNNQHQKRENEVQLLMVSCTN
jgi:hypothetical protein